MLSESAPPMMFNPPLPVIESFPAPPSRMLQALSRIVSLPSPPSSRNGMVQGEQELFVMVSLPLPAWIMVGGRLVVEGVDAVDRHVDQLLAIGAIEPR